MHYLKIGPPNGGPIKFITNYLAKNPASVINCLDRKSTRLNSFPTRRSSDLFVYQ